MSLRLIPSRSAVVILAWAVVAAVGPVPFAQAQVNPPVNGQRREEDNRRLTNTVVNHTLRAGLQQFMMSDHPPRVPPPVMHVPPATTSRSFAGVWAGKAAGCGLLAFLAWLFGRKPEDRPPTA